MNSLRFKIIKDKVFEIFVIFLSFLSVVPLFIILFQIFIKGIKVINFEFFVSLPSPPGEKGGGILNALTGTLILILISLILSIPFGVMIGIFLAEFKNRFTDLLKDFVNILQSLPSIVMGILAYIWVVKPVGHFSALSGGVALSLMMLPLIIKSTEETLKMIPFTLKEASFALGASYVSTLWRVILPASAGGILSGVLIGVSRIAGETAPLLFTAFGNPFVNLNPLKPVESLPLLIFKYAMSPYENWQQIAWGGSLVLICIVLFFNIGLKFLVEKWIQKS
jgi:phosphate transport system permease protein